MSIGYSNNSFSGCVSELGIANDMPWSSYASAKHHKLNKERDAEWVHIFGKIQACQNMKTRDDS